MIGNPFPRPSTTLLVQRLLALAAILALWQTAVWTGTIPAIVPGVGAVASAIAGLIVSPAFWTALAQTIGAALLGWAIASAVGVFLGLMIGTMPALDRMTSVLVEFGRAFPTIALLPIFVLILGANARMEVFMVSLACLWPILIQTVYGCRRQDASIVDTVRAFRIPTVLRFRRVLLPAALPFISTGLRIATSMAILVAVGIEVLSQTPGLGRQITLAQEAARWDLAFAFLFYAGLIGWAVASGLSAIESRLLRWNRRREV